MCGGDMPAAVWRWRAAASVCQSVFYAQFVTTNARNLGEILCHITVRRFDFCVECVSGREVDVWMCRWCVFVCVVRFGEARCPNVS